MGIHHLHIYFKVYLAMSFIIPILLFQLSTAVIVSIVYGLSLISIFSYYLAKKEKVNPVNVILEHLVITIFVIIATYLIGAWASTLY